MLNSGISTKDVCNAVAIHETKTILLWFPFEIKDQRECNIEHQRCLITRLDKGIFKGWNNYMIKFRLCLIR